MSVYSINHADLSKNPIIISTGTIDHSTSIGLVGRNASGFGPVIAEDLLHLLENFASRIPPTGSIEGQLWYDTTDSVNKRLRINDGSGLNSNSPELGGVFRSSTSPQNARLGDIWVDTTYNQVNIWNGTSFTLVGPSFSSTYQTGNYPESILGVDGAYHSVIKNYLNGNVLTIIAQESFRPSAVIDGFDSLVPGVNLSTKSFNGITPTFNGVATYAAALKVTIPATQIISANNFFRKDLPQSLSEVLTINNNSGLSIGLTSSTFLLTKSGRDAVITNTADQANIIFKIDNRGIRNSILTIAGQTQRVGINNINANPKASLDVNGSVLISGATTVTNLFNVIGDTTITGNVQLNSNLTVNANTIFVDTITVSATATNVAISPGAPSVYDLGTVDNHFRRVWVDYIGTGTTRLEGSAYAADQLTNPRTFSISGQLTAPQVTFNGTQPVNLVASLNSQAINAQTSTSTAATSYTLPVSNPDSASIYRITKQNFLADVTPNLVKPGFIMMSTSIGGNPPTGWLWCDGASYSTGGDYSRLYNALLNSGSIPPYGSSGPGSFYVPRLDNVVPVNSANSSTFVVRYMIKY